MRHRTRAGQTRLLILFAAVASGALVMLRFGWRTAAYFQLAAAAALLVMFLVQGPPADHIGKDIRRSVERVKARR